VTVWNRSPQKAEAWVARHPGQRAATAARGGRRGRVRHGLRRQRQRPAAGLPWPRGCLCRHGGRAIFVDHTTVSASVTRELAALAAVQGAGYVDAPVSGGQAGAENGQLSIMCGGSAADYARAEPVMAAYARICRRLGDSGAGQMAKMMNQICIAGLMQGLSEALAFGQKAGMDGERWSR
jgi:3-hydroxyisobutyrate dehydrogenase